MNTIDWTRLEHAAFQATSPYYIDPTVARAGLELVDRTDALLASMSSDSSEDEASSRSETASEPEEAVASGGAAIYSNSAAAAVTGSGLNQEEQAADDEGIDEGTELVHLPTFVDVIFTVEL